MRLAHILFCAAGVAARCPEWHLPWGDYHGEHIDGNICIYRNVRYASPPVGNLRFRAPEYPPREGLPPTAWSHPTCVQMDFSPCLDPTPLTGEGKESCYGPYYGQQTEDCLFLDVYVPRSVLDFKQERKASVVVWFYGGGYVAGSKSWLNPNIVPFYDGSGFLDRAAELGKPTIFVTGNYRLGAFGWLAGRYFKRSSGQPNAGLLDQRAMLQFVRDYIGGIGGNREDVSVWGESAGASSIMHHMVMPKNIADPLFKKAILMSPAYQWMWDQKQILNDTFTHFYNNVSQINGPGTNICSPGQTPLDCLRNNPKVTTEVLRKANQLLFQEAACRGVLPVGPSVDGELVPTLAPISFYNGEAEVAQNIESVIISHTNNEIPYTDNAQDWSFIPRNVRRENRLQAVEHSLNALFSGPIGESNKYAAVMEAINMQYPPSNHRDQIDRIRAILTDVAFTCNARFMINTFLQSGKAVYAQNYAVLSKNGADSHASDLLPAFQNSRVGYTDLMKCQADVGWIKAKFANKLIRDWTGYYMQAYFVAHAATGSPNNPLAYAYWPPAINDQICSAGQRFGTCVQNVMRPETSYWNNVWGNSATEDTQTSNATCAFWQEMALLTMQIYDEEDSD